MEKDLVKRMVKKDGSQRISFYREDYAENPRYMTDEPLHCEDWDRNHSIMNNQERETNSENARDLIEYLLKNFGESNKIIDLLVENGKHLTDGESTCNNALVYERSARRWVLKVYDKWYGDKDYDWKDAAYFDCKREDLDAGEVLECVLESTIDFFVEQGCLTDKVKVMSYDFGYYGGITFRYEFSTDSEGICWLEKDEFLKYSGNDEEYWNDKSLDEIEWLLDELEAWGDNEVYGFVVEDCIKSKIHKEYTNVDKEPEDYEEEEWEESDSCWGFYGKLDKSLVWMFDNSGLERSDFYEV